MALIERKSVGKNVREITFSETILNNVMYRLSKPAKRTFVTLTQQEFLTYKPYIKYLIDREFKIEPVKKPQVPNMPIYIKDTIDNAIKQGKKDYLRTLKK